MNGKSILIIEDEKPLLKALANLFSGHDYTVLQADNGQAGLDTAIAQKPGIIILDLNMPKMDGVTFMEYLRQDSWGKNVPVIVLTNLQPDPEVVNSLARTNPAYYLIKADWNLTDIYSKVEEVLTQSQSA